MHCSLESAGWRRAILDLFLKLATILCNNLSHLQAGHSQCRAQQVHPTCPGIDHRIRSTTTWSTLPTFDLNLSCTGAPTSAPMACGLRLTDGPQDDCVGVRSRASVEDFLDSNSVVRRPKTSAPPKPQARTCLCDSCRHVAKLSSPSLNPQQVTPRCLRTTQGCLQWNLPLDAIYPTCH